MLTAPTYRSVEGAYLALLQFTSTNYEQHIAARGNEAREVIGVGFCLTDPRQRLPYLVTRKANPIFQFAEALWYLAGRRDLEMIGYYAPSMRSSSPDGVNLGGSSYGYTLFNPAEGDTVSPFDRVLELLRTERDSKRGYLPVFSAAELAVSDNPDMACLAGLHLFAREGRLHMVCYMRANDLDCGLLSDVFSFTMIQEYAAVQLGLELGTYTHFIGSAHVNDRNAERVKKVLNEADVRRHPQHFPFPAMSEETNPATIARVLEHEELLRTNKVQYSADDVAGLDVDAYWEQAVLLFEVYRQIEHDKTDTVSRDVLDALHPGLRWLLGHRWPACATTEGRAVSRKPPSGAVVEGIDFDRWAVILCKPDAVARGLVGAVLERIAAAGVTVTSRRDLTAQAWQAHVAYRDLLTNTGATPRVLPARIDAAYANRPVVVALAHGEPGVHAHLRQLIGHTDPPRAVPGTIRRDLGNDSLAAALAEKRLVRNLVHTSDDADAARRDFGTWLGTGRPLEVPDFERCSVILCKPDAVERGLVDAVLERIAAAGATVTDRRDITVEAWQAHVHYWDLLVDADWFPDRDIPACLEAEYGHRPVAVALAHGEPGFHGRLRQLLGHFDPTHAAPGTIRADLGDDSLEVALAEKRLVRNLVHTSDDADAARRDFGTWFGAGRRELLAPPVPLQATPADA